MDVIVLLRKLSWCPTPFMEQKRLMGICCIQNQLAKDAYRQVQILQAELGANAGGSPGQGARDLL